MSDIEIAQANEKTEMKPIQEIGAMVGLTPDELEPYGRSKAKLTLAAMKRLKASRSASWSWSPRSTQPRPVKASPQ